MHAHFLIQSSGDRMLDVRLALTFGANVCASRGVAVLDVIVPHKNYLPSIDVGDALGHMIAERLAKHGTAPVKIGDKKILLRLHEPETAVASKDIRVAAVFYLVPKNMERLVSANIGVTIFLPHLANEGAAWAKQWSAVPPPESEGARVEAYFSETAKPVNEELTAWEMVSAHPMENYPDALEEIYGKRPTSEWLEAFRLAWHFSDSILQNEGKWRKLLPMADGHLTHEAERVLLEAMPDKITVFRGCTQEWSNGLSWSISDYWAHFFPKNRHGVIVKGVVEKVHVLAYLRINEEEEELVIFPEHVTNKTVLERWLH